MNACLSEKNIGASLIPRKEKHKKMLEQNQIPTSTASKFIIPCLERSFGFKTNQYLPNSTKLSRFIDANTFENFVRRANKIIDYQLYEKAKKQTEPFFSIISLLLKLSIVIAIFTFTILSAIVYGDIDQEVSDTILIISVILIVFSVVIATLCPIFLYRSEYQEENHEKIIKEKLDKLAEEQNMKLELSGSDFLKWKFQEDYFWIQFNIDETYFKSQNNQQSLPFLRRQPGTMLV